MADTLWSPRTKTVVFIIILLGTVWLAIVLNPLLNALIIAALLAYLLNPLVNLLMRRTRVNRTWGAGLVFVIFVLLLASLPAALGTVAVGQFQRIWTELVEAWAALEHWIAQPIELLGFRIYPQLILDNLEQASGSLISTLPEGSFNILSGVTANLLWGIAVFVSLFYFLKDGPKIKYWLVEFTPAEYQSDVQRLLDEIDEVWGVFIRAQLLIFVVIAALMAGGTFLVIWLFRTGLLSFSPLVFILLLILVYTAVQQVDNLWLRPQFMGRRLLLHPGIVFVGLTGAFVVGGVLGALIIVPLMATVRVVGRYVYCKLMDLPPWSQDNLEIAYDVEEVEPVHNHQVEAESVSTDLIPGGVATNKPGSQTEVNLGDKDDIVQQ